MGALIAVAALGALVAVWDWDWFAPLAGRQASRALGRHVAIAHVHVGFGTTARITLGEASVDNPPQVALPSPMAEIGRIEFGIELAPLLRGKIVLPYLTIDDPNGRLGTDAGGHANWTLDQPDGTPASAPSQSFPAIGQLTIHNGKLSITVPGTKTDLRLTIATRRERGDDIITLDGSGTYNGAPAIIHGRGDAVLSLRDPSKPYGFKVTADFGGTKSALEGTVVRADEHDGIRADFHLAGPDLAGLFPLTGIALPPTPAYDLTGVLTFVGHVYRVEKFAGRLGASDLRGDLSFEPAHGEQKRGNLIAHFVSKQVRMTDLGGFIGATPGDAAAANASADHKAQAEANRDSPDLLPRKPLDFTRLRAMDADITYDGLQIVTANVPLDNFNAHFLLRDGVLTVDPWSFGVGSGTIKLSLILDGRNDPAQIKAKADFQKVDFGRVMRSTTFTGGGTIGGSAVLDSHGNSLADMLGNGDGNLALFMQGGQINQLLTALGKVDVPQVLGLATSVRPADLPPDNTAVRCMVGDWPLAKGIMTLRVFVLDTTDSLFTMTGTIDLKQQTIDVEMVPHPKTTSIGVFQPPIEIKGTLKSPAIYPEPLETGARVAATVALGILATPLGALLPSIDLGLGEDADCSGLVHQAAGQAADSHAKPLKIVPQRKTNRHDRPALKH